MEPFYTDITAENKFSNDVRDIVSDDGATGSDDVQKETSHSSSDLQNIANEHESDPTTGNIDKGSVMTTERNVHKDTSAKDVETSQISSAKHVTEVKNVGTKRSEM